MSIKRIHRFLIFISLTVIFLGCQKDIYRFDSKFSLPKINTGKPLVQFLLDDGSYANILESDHLKKTLDYTKIPFISNSIEEFNKNPKILESVRSIVLQETLAIENAGIDSIVAFVAKGGTLHLSKSIHDPRMHFLMGVRPEAKLNKNLSAKGFHFNQPLFPGKVGLIQDYSDSFLGLARENFKDQISIIVSAKNDHEYPVLLENKVGLGKVIFTNSTLTFLKSMRGFMFASLLYGLEGIPYPIANVATIFLDDFPSPTYNIYKEPIKSEMNLTIAEFVKDVWWPDMKKLALRHNMKYTAYVTFDYNSNVYPPFGFLEWDQNKVHSNRGEVSSSSWLGTNVIEAGHELGFHGYNHVSLLEEDWKNPDYMVTALKAAEKKWKVLGFKDLPVSYVPPSNYIDSVGLQKLYEGMPSLRFMQSIYLGKFEEGGNREFDPDPINNRFFDYPRISSGYYFEPTTEWSIESMYLYTGIWSHFVHPDDVYQIPDKSNEATSGHFSYRNKYSLNWHSSSNKKGMLDVFEDFLIDYESRHPFVRFKNATDASNTTVNWRYAEYSHIQNEGVYEVESFNSRNKVGENYWLMYAENENIVNIDRLLLEQGLQNKKVSFLDGYLYSIKTSQAAISVLDLKPKSLYKDDNIAMVFKQKLDFENLRTSLMSFEDQLTKFVENDDLPNAINLIERYLKINKNADSKVIKDYAQYMVWQNRENSFWLKYDSYYQKNSNASLAMLATDLNQIVGYPSMEVQQLWMDRQIKFKTEDVGILKEYYDVYNSKDNIEQISYVLSKLYELEPNDENTKNYINHLIESEDSKLISFLNTIPSCSIDSKEIATTIAWVYANNLVFEKALSWKSCTKGISNETIDYWIFNSKDFEKYKKTDFTYYIGLLLANDQHKAKKELLGIEPCREDIAQYANRITKIFGDFDNYKNALAWSYCSTAVSIKDIMTWYFEIGQFSKLEDAYKEYIILNLDDYEIKNHMATFYLYESKVAEAAKIAIGMPLNEVDEKLKLAINNEVQQMDLFEQLKFSRLYLDILTPTTNDIIKQKNRQYQGASIGASYNSINDRLDPTMASTGVYYQFYNAKGNAHRFTLTRSSMYAIKTLSDVESNVDKDLLGLGYSYSIRPRDEKNYFFNSRLEKDNENKFYYQVGLGYNRSNKKRFSAYRLDLFPVQSGPGYELNIYRLMLNVYKEIPLGSLFKQILSLEANYYTDSQTDAVFVGRYEYYLVNQNIFKINPYVEGAIGRGSINRRRGYPYWLAKERLFGGGGLQFTFGNEKSKFNLITDFGLFAENKERDFERYLGSLQFRPSNYLTFKGTFEVYTIENFYSNVFQFGVDYKFD